ncbi:hypothetical protein DNA98_14935 [Meiothermus sp. Pnk-1]|nr:hypothetical protein DNA98_14935 [Meiothermus sp. Pnk-1]
MLVVLRRQPLGILGCSALALLLSLLSLGLLFGPLQVGLAKVLLRLARDGVWEPQAQWSEFRWNTWVAGVLFLGLFVAPTLALPIRDDISGQIAAFFYQGVVALFWFYTFTLMADTKRRWWEALRESWHLVRDHGPWGHVALVLLAILGGYFPTGPAPDLLGLVILVLFVGLSTLGQVVAYLEVSRPRLQPGVWSRGDG